MQSISMSEVILDQLYGEPSKGPFLYEAKEADIAFLDQISREYLVNQGRTYDVAWLTGIGQCENVHFFAKRAGNTLLEIACLEEATHFTDPGATVFSLFNIGRKGKAESSCSFAITKDNRTGQSRVTHYSSQPQYGISQDGLEMIFGHMRQDIKSILDVSVSLVPVQHKARLLGRLIGKKGS